jgi:hypothetical protein
MEVDKFKIGVLVVLLVGAGYFGLKKWKEAAADATDDELLAKYVSVPFKTPQGAWNDEAHARVKSGKITFAQLKAKAGKGEDSVRQAAFRLMIFVPLKERDDALKTIEAEWKSQPSTECKKEMINTVYYLIMMKPSVGEPAQRAGIKWLVEHAVKDPTPEVEAAAAGVLSSITEQKLHKKEEWRQWYGSNGAYKVRDTQLIESPL